MLIKVTISVAIGEERPYTITIEKSINPGWMGDVWKIARRLLRKWRRNRNKKKSKNAQAKK